jgi:hypothetical protein
LVYLHLHLHLHRRQRCSSHNTRPGAEPHRKL